MKKSESNIIELLQNEMALNGYISKDSILEIAKKTETSESEVFGVASFYKAFKFLPKAKYEIQVCTGTACFVLGADKILKAIYERLKICENERTADGKFALVPARCVGCCSLAPVVMINGEVHGKMTAKKMDQLLDSLI
ncbi:MAG: NAD(P)H-dependent oxidoreductase subunit E [Clostridia bacterium]